MTLTLPGKNITCRSQARIKEEGSHNTFYPVKMIIIIYKYKEAQVYLILCSYEEAQMSYAKSTNFHFFKTQVSSSLKHKCPFKKAQMSYQKVQMSFASSYIIILGESYS
jgi:acid stress-induced BolA-like protein IbaG/YrbA